MLPSHIAAAQHPDSLHNKSTSLDIQHFKQKTPTQARLQTPSKLRVSPRPCTRRQKASATTWPAELWLMRAVRCAHQHLKRQHTYNPCQPSMGSAAEYSTVHKRTIQMGKAWRLVYTHKLSRGVAFLLPCVARSAPVVEHNLNPSSNLNDSHVPNENATTDQSGHVCLGVDWSITEYRRIQSNQNCLAHHCAVPLASELVRSACCIGAVQCWPTHPSINKPIN